MSLSPKFSKTMNQAREIQKARRKALKAFDGSISAQSSLDAINGEYASALEELAHFVLDNREAISEAIRQFDEMETQTSR